MPSAPADPVEAVQAADPPQPVVVRGLVRRYGSTTAVDGLELTARAGAVTAVLGPNGAGKTTAIECCEGLRQPTSGTVRVLGVDPWRAGPQHRAQVGVMLQDGGLPMAVRALDLLRHVARLYANPWPVADLADQLGITSFARTTVRRLSGGQRQRLALACAVVGRPRVVFLDEPSAGLDPQARLVVWELVDQLRREGAAVLLTTHLMDEAERLADQVFVVDAGRVVASGSPSELTGSRHNSDLVRFHAPPRMDLTALQRALPEDVTVEEPQPGAYVVHGAVDPAVLSTVTAWCAGQGVMAEGLTVARRSLEDVFLDLTGRNLR